MFLCLSIVTEIFFFYKIQKTLRDNNTDPFPYCLLPLLKILSHQLFDALQ
jgi:hypothetical protein